MPEPTTPTRTVPPREQSQPSRVPGGGERAGWVVPFRIVALLITFAILAVGAASVVGAFFTRHRVETRTFAEPITRLELTNTVGNLRIRAGAPGDAARATLTRTAALVHPTIATGVSDGTLRISGSCPGWAYGPPILGSCSIDVDVDLPPGTTVQVRSRTGRIDVQGRLGDVTATTATGDIRVYDAAGDVELTTTTGNLRVLRAAAESISARSRTGTVELTFVRPPGLVRLRTNTGNVTVTVPNDGTAYDVLTTTGTGNPRVRVPVSSSASRRIDIVTGTGNIAVQLPAE